MPHPVIHAEVRSQDPDATREFFAQLFDWKVASEGGFPGYTFMDTGVQGGPAVAISPRQGAEDEVLFFVLVEDVAATLSRAEELGGRIVQPAQNVPGCEFRRPGRCSRTQDRRCRQLMPSASRARSSRPTGRRHARGTQWWSCPAITDAFGDPSPLASSYPGPAAQHETLLNTELVPVVMSRNEEGPCLAM